MSIGMILLLVWGINAGVNLLLELLYCWLDYKTQMHNKRRFSMELSRIMQGIFLLIFGFIGTILIIMGLFDDFEEFEVINIKQKTEEEKQKPYNKKWISINKRKPKIDTCVLVYAKLPELNGQLIDVLLYTSQGFKNNGSLDEELVSKITHWMELPEPPKE